jgi:RNA polymerase sigma-70 factor (sigma-E family)
VVASHDDGSFEAFVAARGAALLRTARLLCRAPEDAEDVCQAALERAYRHWSRIRGDNPEPYVRRILVNLVINRARRAALLSFVTLGDHSDRTTDDPSARAAPGAAAEADRDRAAVEVRGALIAGLRALSPRQRAVLVLRYWEDMSEAQAGEILGCSVGTVKAHASRGLARLRELVDGDLARRG